MTSEPRALDQPVERVAQHLTEGNSTRLATREACSATQAERLLQIMWKNCAAVL